jgi:hypothetical protein
VSEDILYVAQLLYGVSVTLLCCGLEALWARGVEGAEVKVTFATALFSLSLCSCAAHNDTNMVGLTAVGDDRQVTVSHVRNKTDGFPLADKHCKQFGKSARLDKMEGTRAIYNCQSPS